MKKIAFLLACLMGLSIFALAGCGGEDDNDPPDVRVVKVWLHKSEAEAEGIVYKAIAEAFNEQNEMTDDGRRISVKLEFMNSSDALSTAIAGEMLTNGLPDIVAVDSPNIAAYASNGILTNISGYLSNETKNSYVDSVIEQSTYNGGLYALSGMDAPGGLYYNKELLKAVGYTDADFGTLTNPWSWLDVKEAMQALKAAGKPYKIKLNLGFGGDEGCMYLYSSLVYSSGGSFVGANEKIYGSLDSDASLNGIKMLEKIYEGNSANNWVYNGTNENAFPGEEVAFEIFGPWLVNTIKKSYPSFVSKYGIMPYPVYESASGSKGSLVGPCGSWGFGVTPNSRDKAAAAKVVAFFTGKDSSQLMYESIGTYPTNKELLSDLEDFSSGAAKSLAELLVSSASPRPKLAKYPNLSAAYSDIIEYIETKLSTGASDYNLSGYVKSKAQHADSY